jgi:hypothetical protein
MVPFFRSTVPPHAARGVGRVGCKVDGPARLELRGAVDAVTNQLIVTVFISPVPCPQVRSNVFAEYEVEIVHVLANPSATTRGDGVKRVSHISRKTRWNAGSSSLLRTGYNR